jgi:hypothetical protein
MEYRFMLNTNNAKTKTLIDKYKPIAESLKAEIEAISETIKLHSFTIDSLKMNPTYYIPTLEDWHYLHTNRKEFLNVEKTSIADKLNFATPEMLQNKANEFIEWINEYKCKEFIDNINPLPYGAKWYDFIMFVHWIDCYNYYNELATPQPETQPEKMNLNSKPLLQWNTTANTLYTLFYDLLENKLITWNGKESEGEKMEIARMLVSHFVNKDGEALSIETIKQALKPDTTKAKKRIDIKAITLPKNQAIKKT